MKRKTYFEHVPLASIRAAEFHDQVAPAPPQRKTAKNDRPGTNSVTGSPLAKVVDDDSSV
jgi:hypothetical protein